MHKLKMIEWRVCGGFAILFIKKYEKYLNSKLLLLPKIPQLTIKTFFSENNKNLLITNSMSEFTNLKSLWENKAKQ